MKLWRGSTPVVFVALAWAASFLALVAWAGLPSDHVAHIECPEGAVPGAPTCHIHPGPPGDAQKSHRYASSTSGVAAGLLQHWSRDNSGKVVADVSKSLLSRGVQPS